MRMRGRARVAPAVSSAFLRFTPQNALSCMLIIIIKKNRECGGRTFRCVQPLIHVNKVLKSIDIYASTQIFLSCFAHRSPADLFLVSCSQKASISVIGRIMQCRMPSTVQTVLNAPKVCLAMEKLRVNRPLYFPLCCRLVCFAIVHLRDLRLFVPLHCRDMERALRFVETQIKF